MKIKMFTILTPESGRSDEPSLEAIEASDWMTNNENVTELTTKGGNVINIFCTLICYKNARSFYVSTVS